MSTRKITPAESQAMIINGLANAGGEIKADARRARRIRRAARRYLASEATEPNHVAAGLRGL